MTLDPEVALRWQNGALTTEEADSFENDFLGRPEFRDYLEESGLLELYLTKKLTGSELDAVEKALLADPGLMEHIEDLSVVEQGLNQLQGTEARSSGRSVTSGSSLWRTPQYAAAASFAAAALLVFSGFLLVDNQNLRREITSFDSSLMTRTIPLIANVRGGDTVNQVELPESGELTVLLVDAEHIVDGVFVLLDDYRATVTRISAGDPSVIFGRSGLTPNGDGTIAVTIADHLLTEGDYQLELDGRLNDWPADTFERVSLVSFTIEDPE